jgi:CRP/FNR family transcriptional regulator, cyclic AMP receptor protein
MDVESLRAVPFLAHLSNAELKDFSALLEAREFKEGDRILEEGTVPVAFQIVRDGIVHVRRRAGDGNEKFLNRLGPGSFFADINLFDPGVATASIYAAETTHTAMIPYVRLRSFMDENPGAGYRIVSAMLSEVCRRLRASNERLANLGAASESSGGGWSG